MLKRCDYCIDKGDINIESEYLKDLIKGKKVVLDFGHGGSDPGGIGIMGTKEKDIVLSIGLMVFNALKSIGINTLATRNKDEFISLKARCDISNNFNADLFVSIHCNAFNQSSAKGLEVFHYPTSSKGKEFSKMVIDDLVEEKLYTVNRGVKTSNNFYVLKKTRAAALLVELGFITNHEDLTLIQNNMGKYAETLSKSIVKCLQNL